ncbi:uncharacterized protein LOC110271957 [Arachis ipaensis]|uniref:uncharacterized protein LOC110271957 n=1 Tax=Arachis ipaensis TaxID=130454 RepID=UPI000A2B7EB6|nr:uncharacterized protein LOC110271957 [Arachis ipaensis]
MAQIRISNLYEYLQSVSLFPISPSPSSLISAAETAEIAGVRSASLKIKLYPNPSKELPKSETNWYATQFLRPDLMNPLRNQPPFYCSLEQVVVKEGSSSSSTSSSIITMKKTPQKKKIIINPKRQQQQQQHDNSHTYLCIIHHCQQQQLLFKKPRICSGSFMYAHVIFI